MHTIADHIAESGLEGDEAIIKAVQAARCIKGLDYALLIDLAAAYSRAFHSTPT